MVWDNLRFVQLPVEEEKKYLLEKGDILFNRTNSAELVGKSAVFDGSRKAVFASYIIRFRLRPDEADPNFYCDYINSPVGKSFIAEKMVRAIGQVNVSASTMLRMPVPIPPLGEQRRIAGRLREQMAEVARARAAVQAQLAAAQALPAAVLRAHFATPAALRWPRHRLGDVTDISSGITLGRKLNGRSTRPVPYLRVANVKDGWLDLTEVKEVEATENEIRDCLLAPGDILLTEGGDPDKLGRGTFWRGEVTECIHQNHIFRVRAEPTRFEPAFLAFQFGSGYGKAYFLAHAKQTTGIASINKTVLSNFPLLVPPLPEQRALAARLTAELSAATALRESLSARLAAIERLPAALLRTAFNGR